MNISKQKQLTVSAAISYLTIAAKILSGIIYMPILLHSLGQSEYGVYSLCLSFMSYLTIFNAGINAAYIRFYVQIKEKKLYSLEKINGIFVEILTALGIIGMILGFVVAFEAEWLFGSKIMPEEYEVLKRTLSIIAVTVLVSSVNGIFTSMILANEKYVAAKLIDFLHTCIVPVITVPFLLMGHGTVTIMKISLALTVVTLTVNAAYTLRKLGVKFDFGLVDGVLFRSILVFAAFITLQSVMDQLNWQVDTYVLTRFQGSAEVAVYSVGAMFNSYFIMIIAAVINLFIVEINRLVVNGKNAEISALFIKTSRLLTQVAFFIMSAFVIFGKAFIRRWSGPGYENSYYVALLIMLPMTVAFSQGLGQNIARAKNLHRTQIVINMAISVLNLIISIPLAQLYGAIGSAFGTFLCEIVICTIVQGIYYHRVVKLDMVTYYKEMGQLLPGWIIPALFGLVLNHFDLLKSNYISIAVYGSIYTVLYLCSVWGFALSPSEKRMLSNIVGKVQKEE